MCNLNQSESDEISVKGAELPNQCYDDGEIVNYSYNEGGYLSSIIGTSTGSVTENYMYNIKYNELGQRTSLKYGNGVETTYTYTKETGLLDIMKQTDKNGAQLLNYDYDFDLTGNLTKLTDKPNNINKTVQNYTYDLNGRISTANGSSTSGASYDRTYTFDDDNRILTKSFEGKTYTFGYLENTHAISSIAISGVANQSRVDFNYDDYGNMTKKTLVKSGGNEVTGYTYDVNNKLVHIDLPTGYMLDMKYDNGSQRLTKEYSDGVGTISKNVYINGFYEKYNGAINKHISDGQYIFASKLLMMQIIFCTIVKTT